MKKSALIQRVSLLTLMHFLVDFICVFSVLFRYQTCIDWDNIWVTILVYDCLAFLTQPLMGMLVDKNCKSKQLQIFMIIGFLTTALGALATYENLPLCLLLGPTGIFIGPVLLGLANSLFHVIGGKEVLVINDKSKLGGIYVSSGAFGLGLGTYLSFQLTAADVIPAIVLIVSVVILLAVTILHKFLPVSNTEADAPVNYKVVGATPIKIVLLLASAICIAIGCRSLLGYAGATKPYLTMSYTVLITAGCAVLGKAFGGVLQDFFGARVVILVSTVLGILSLVLPTNIVLHPTIFVFSVNLLMPVTLDMIRRLLPKKEGLAFGLTAMFALVGYLVFLLIQTITWLKVLSIIVTCLTGVILFIIDLYIRKKLCQI